MSAILFGSISTIADTSELQRRAFNEAFAAHKLGWTWEQADYAAMLEKNGGSDRIADYAIARGQEIDAGAVHATKSEIFQQLLVSEGVVPRAGVSDTMWEAHSAGFNVGLVTTTSPANVQALINALRIAVDLPDFDVVIDASDVDKDRRKPDPAAYLLALQRLNNRAHTSIAVEDNLGGVASAVAARIACVAFPNVNTSEHSFEQATLRMDRLEFAPLRAILATQTQPHSQSHAQAH